MPAAPHSHIDALERLGSERGVDTRSTLLRVVTDLFLQAPAHTPSDVVRYVDLALPLLDAADPATRLTVASKLAESGDVPEAILKRLLDDPDILVATAVIVSSKQLPYEALTTFALDGEVAEALAVARRRDLDIPLARILAMHPNRMVAETLIENQSAPLDVEATRTLVARARSDKGLAEALLQREGVPLSWLAPLYPLAMPDVRARIRLGIAAEGGLRELPLPPDIRETLRSLLASNNRAGFGAALMGALRLNPAYTAHILDDPTGELLALALTAVGCERSEVVSALLIAAVPEVRLSVQQLYAAAAVHAETSRRAARRIVSAVAEAAVTPAPAYEPHMDPSSAPQRGGSTTRRTMATRVTRRSDVLGGRS